LPFLPLFDFVPTCRILELPIHAGLPALLLPMRGKSGKVGGKNGKDDEADGTPDPQPSSPAGKGRCGEASWRMSRDHLSAKPTTRERKARATGDG
jgi:hypothetical protein